jgi:hypothetical protein
MSLPLNPHTTSLATFHLDIGSLKNIGLPMKTWTWQTSAHDVDGHDQTKQNLQ